MLSFQTDYFSFYEITHGDSESLRQINHMGLSTLQSLCAWHRVQRLHNEDAVMPAKYLYCAVQHTAEFKYLAGVVGLKPFGRLNQQFWMRRGSLLGAVHRAGLALAWPTGRDKAEKTVSGGYAFPCIPASRRARAACMQHATCDS